MLPTPSCPCICALGPWHPHALASSGLCALAPLYSHSHTPLCSHDLAHSCLCFFTIVLLYCCSHPCTLMPLCSCNLALMPLCSHALTPSCLCAPALLAPQWTTWWLSLLYILHRISNRIWNFLPLLPIGIGKAHYQLCFYIIINTFSQSEKPLVGKFLCIKVYTYGKTNNIILCSELIQSILLQ